MTGSGRRPQRPSSAPKRTQTTARPIPAVGPLSRLITADSRRITPAGGYRLRRSQFDADANPLIMLHRVAFFDDRRRKLDDTGQRALLRWAAEHNLGQQDDLVTSVSVRRAAAIASLRDRGLHVRRLTWGVSTSTETATGFPAGIASRNRTVPCTESWRAAPSPSFGGGPGRSLGVPNTRRTAEASISLASSSAAAAAQARRDP